jgi:hypothetical protein
VKMDSVIKVIRWLNIDMDIDEASIHFHFTLKQKKQLN